LLNGYRRWNTANIVHARLVHAIEKLPHVRAERFDVAALAFRVNCLERQTRFAAAARTRDDRQFSQWKIDIDPFKIVLARAPDLHVIVALRSENALFFPDLRTHWRQFQIVGRFANLRREDSVEIDAMEPLKTVRCNFCRKGRREKPLRNVRDLRLSCQMTVLEVLHSTTGYFHNHNVESPRLNAEHLLAHVLGRKRIELYLEFERELKESELAPMRDLVKRRAEGEPLQHLLGTVEFCGRTFLCDKRALVPRPETENLVELLIRSFKSEIASGRIVDVGTGSGVIALSLAAELPEAEIIATDVSEDALALAHENAERLGLACRIRFLKSSLLEKLEGMFDLIAANLPYISTQERRTLSREVLHDPDVALFAGAVGDELVRGLIDQASLQFRPGGILALEIGISQSETLIAALAEKNYRDICTKNDYSGVTRFLFARYG
jgi:release factor glutamine methyltransferase